MSLNFKIQIHNENLARRHELSMNKRYEVDTMDHESYYIMHPLNDERVEIPFKDAQEFRPKY